MKLASRLLRGNLVRNRTMKTHKLYDCSFTTYGYVKGTQNPYREYYLKEEADAEIWKLEAKNKALSGANKNLQEKINELTDYIESLTSL